MRRPVAVIAALAAILFFLSAPANAAATTGNGIGAINHGVEPLVGPLRHETPGQRQGEAATRAGIVVATGVAANTGTGGNGIA